MMKKKEDVMKDRVYVFMANGTEEIECLTVVDILRRAGVDTILVSMRKERSVEGAHGICVEADICFDESDYSGAKMLVLPGGLPGVDHLFAHQGLKTLLKDFADKGGDIAAICAAPSILGKMGILNGKRATCYPGFEESFGTGKYTGEAVTVDGNIITGRGMGCAVDFSLALVKKLVGDEIAREIKVGVQHPDTLK